MAIRIIDHLTRQQRRALNALCDRSWRYRDVYPEQLVRVGRNRYSAVAYGASDNFAAESAMEALGFTFAVETIR